MTRWMRAWDGLDGKEKNDVRNKLYMEVNDGVWNDTTRYIGEVWTERQRNERKWLP